MEKRELSSAASVSSLKRHEGRCHRNVRALSRQKACRFCSDSKLRCDLQRPACSRCRSRAVDCQYPSLDAGEIAPPASQRSPPAYPSPSTQGRRPRRSERRELSPTDDLAPDASLSFSDTWRDTGLIDNSAATLPSPGTATPPTIAHGPPRDAGHISPELLISAERKRVLMGQPGTASSDIVLRHTRQFVVRILRLWPRMLASYSTTGHLPPVIHKLQLAEKLPPPLANCSTLVKMWADHSEDGSRALVRNTIIEEVRRLLREVRKCADNLPSSGPLCGTRVVSYFVR